MKYLSMLIIASCGFVGGYGMAEFLKTGNLVFLLSLIPSAVGLIYVFKRK